MFQIIGGRPLIVIYGKFTAKFKPEIKQIRADFRFRSPEIHDHYVGTVNGPTSIIRLRDLKM